MENVLVTVSFYLLALVCVVGTMGVVFSGKMVNASLLLLLSFTGVAGVFLLLNSDFVAMAQILVYSIAIAIIVIFAVMLTNPATENLINFKRPRAFISIICCALIYITIIFTVGSGTFLTQTRTDNTVARMIEEGTTGIIGDALFSLYVLPFEVISILLLAAIVGAAVLARRKIES